MIGTDIWISTLAPLLACTVALWAVSLLLKNASIIDIFWGLGFVVSFWLTYIQTSRNNNITTILLGVLVTVWGLRLAIHILLRSIGKGEDKRYAQFRANNAPHWWWSSLFKVFLLQGLLIWLISAPISIMQVSPTPMSLITTIGLLVWIIGFVFEAGSDWQLMRFKSDPTNNDKLLTTGFWEITRHPNYFGDATQWWAFWLISVTQATWWTIFSPILITILLLNVSGVPITEKSMRRDKPDYRYYIDNVPSFVPNFLNIFRSDK